MIPTDRVRRLVLSVPLPLLFAALACHSVLRENWKDSTVYPTRVEVVVFGNNALDSQNCLDWKTWTVCFGSNLPLARFGYTGGSYRANQVTIRPLQCENRLTGKIECEIQLIWPQPDWCFLSGEDLRFEIYNGSKMILPYLSFGIRGKLRPPKNGPFEGGAFLPVASIFPGETAIIEKGCYKELIAPNDTEIFELPEPGPEDRDQYWEFKAQQL